MLSCVVVLQICLLCRRRGHSLKQCPNNNDDSVDVKICYNCGESGHSLANCPLPIQDGNFECFFSWLFAEKFMPLIPFFGLFILLSEIFLASKTVLLQL